MSACLSKYKKITTLLHLDKIRKRLRLFSRKGEISEGTRNQYRLICQTNKNIKNSKMYYKRTRMTLRNVLKKEARAMLMIKLTLMKNLISRGRKTKLIVHFMLTLSKII
jgi:hypothetical protein